jgi:hypothetical protein
MRCLFSFFSVLTLERVVVSIIRNYQCLFVVKTKKKRSINFKCLPNVFKERVSEN